MITIAQAVQDYVLHNPRIRECLQHGIINTTALARHMVPYIQETCFKDTVTVESINMALRRLPLQVLQIPRSYSTKTLQMSLTMGIVEYTYAKTSTNNLQPLLNASLPFTTITQGLYEIAIVTKQLHMHQVEQLMDQNTLLHKQIGLASITLMLPSTNVDEVGLYYLILQVLAHNTIPVTDVISTHNEFSIIMQDAYIDKAFSALKKLFDMQKHS